MDKVKIKIVDDQKPEDLAMLQALYSRSPASVDDHLKKVGNAGSGNFMDKFYIGYGHKSIGDCGTTTIFIEGVTMLTAKAFQDWPLYSGQEASTRYMDFSEAVFSDPLEKTGSVKGREIQERWRGFYLGAGPVVKEHIRKRYPINKGEDKKTYDRAVNARSFDILRSFLPAGAATNLSWHTNLRQAGDHLASLKLHPDPNVVEVANRVWDELIEKYPNSFKNRSDQEEYRSEVMRNHHFLVADSGYPDYSSDKALVTCSFNQHSMEASDIDILKQRTRGIGAPRYLADLGNIQSTFALDFGSYRDLQRHRNGTIRMPLLTTGLGFNSWYLDQLPTELRKRAVALIATQSESIDSLECDPFVRQNYIAMGFNVPCKVTQNLPAFMYRIELRSSKSVHPSLRRIVHGEIKQFRSLFPDVPIYVDEDQDSWTIRRGSQTIEEKS
jgi:thymidylate synthase ThyX